MILKVTNTETGQVFNGEQNLEQLCFDAELDKELVYCDIEGLVQGVTDGTWYMLDECGNWAYMPSKYTSEKVKE